MNWYAIPSLRNAQISMSMVKIRIEECVSNNPSDSMLIPLALDGTLVVSQLLISFDVG
jgi:hypothetical protein